MKRKKYKEFVQFGQGLIYNIYPVKHKKKKLCFKCLKFKEIHFGGKFLSLCEFRQLGIDFCVFFSETTLQLSLSLFYFKRQVLT